MQCLAYLQYRRKRIYIGGVGRLCRKWYEISGGGGMEGGIEGRREKFETRCENAV